MTINTFNELVHAHGILQITPRWVKIDNGWSFLCKGKKMKPCLINWTVVYPPTVHLAVVDPGRVTWQTLRLTSGVFILRINLQNPFSEPTFLSWTASTHVPVPAQAIHPCLHGSSSISSLKVCSLHPVAPSILTHAVDWSWPSSWQVSELVSCKNAKT